MIQMNQNKDFTMCENAMFQLISRLNDGDWHEISKKDISLIGLDPLSYFCQVDFPDNIQKIEISITEELDPKDLDDEDENFLTFQIKIDDIVMEPGVDAGIMFPNDGQNTDKFFKMWITNFAADLILGTEI